MAGLDPRDGSPTRDELRAVAEQLQATVDRLTADDTRRRARIRKLEADRETLRSRLEQARHRKSRLDRIIAGLSRRSLGPAPDANVGEDPRAAESATEYEGASSRRPNLRVATVVDDFTQGNLAPEFDALPVDADSWREQLTTSPPDLLFVESCFTGHRASWVNRVARIGEPDARLRELVTWCQRRGIPTVFWNKEDPTNYAWFVASAALFDWVFTTDSNSVARYQAALAHQNVAVLPFAAQPRLQQPGGGWTARTGSVAFAGSYYTGKHPERVSQIETVVDPARSYGLEIFDRFGSSKDNRFTWPDRYQPHIVGSLSYAEVLAAYRRYRVFLNVNTVTDSPTMCARRIFELAASKTPIITGPSLAVDTMMPADAICVVTTRQETVKALETLLSDPVAWKQQAEAAYRWVLDGHTYQHRVDTLLLHIG